MTKAAVAAVAVVHLPQSQRSTVAAGAPEIEGAFQRRRHRKTQQAARLASEPSRSEPFDLAEPLAPFEIAEIADTAAAAAAAVAAVAATGWRMRVSLAQVRTVVATQ